MTIIIMNGFKSLLIKNLMLLSKFRNKDGFEHMSRKQLESIFSTLYSSKSIKTISKKPILAPKTKKPTWEEPTPPSKLKRQVLYDLRPT